MASLEAAQYSSCFCIATHALSSHYQEKRQPEEQTLAPKCICSKGVPRLSMSAQISLSSISHMATPKFQGAGKCNTSMNLDREENGQATLCHWYLEKFQISRGTEEQSPKGRTVIACYWLQTWAPISTCHTASEFPGFNDSSLTHLQPRPVFSYLWINFMILELVLIAGTMDKLCCLLVNLFITPVLWWLIKQFSQKTLHTVHSTWKVLTEELNINTKFLYFLL